MIQSISTELYIKVSEGIYCFLVLLYPIKIIKLPIRSKSKRHLCTHSIPMFFKPLSSCQQSNTCCRDSPSPAFSGRAPDPLKLTEDDLLPEKTSLGKPAFSTSGDLENILEKTLPHS